MNYAGPKLMVETTPASNCILGAAYYRRTYPKVRRPMELICEGAIARPMPAHASSNGGFTVEDGWRAWKPDV